MDSLPCGLSHVCVCTSHESPLMMTHWIVYIIPKQSLARVLSNQSALKSGCLHLKSSADLWKHLRKYAENGAAIIKQQLRLSEQRKWKMLCKDMIPHSHSLLRATLRSPALRILREREIFTWLRLDLWGIRPVNAHQHSKPCLCSDLLVLAA